MRKTPFQFQPQNSIVRPYEWFLGKNRAYAVHYSSHGGGTHVVMITRNYRISYKGKVHPEVVCNNDFCTYREKIRLVGWRSYERSCKTKVKYRNLEDVDMNDHEAVYKCKFCNNYHLTKTKYNPENKGHIMPVGYVYYVNGE